MNDIYRELYSKSVDACVHEANRQGLTREEAITGRCLNHPSRPIIKVYP